MTLDEKSLRRANIPERYWRDVALKKVPRTAPYLDTVTKYIEGLPEFVQRGIGLYLWCVTNGTGKTGLATIILRRALKQGLSGYFFSTSQLQESIIDGWTFNQEELVIDRLRSVDVLVLDDFGKEHKGAQGFSLNQLENLVRYRVQTQRTTIFTSNVHPNSIASTISKDLSEVMAEVTRYLEIVDDSKGGFDWREAAMKNIKKLLP